MQTAVHRLVDLLTEVFEEEAWQAPVTASLEGLTASHAAWKPERATNSIWMIVNHLSLWKEYQGARLAGEPPRPSGWAEKLDWHEIHDRGEPAWQAAVQRLKNAQKRLVTGLKARTDEDLVRPCQVAHPRCTRSRAWRHTTPTTAGRSACCEHCKASLRNLSDRPPCKADVVAGFLL